MIAERDTKTDFRAEEEAGKKYIEGYFAVFGDTYEMNEGISESIDPTAFDETLGGDVRALINHDTGMVLGRTKNGTLRLAVDSTGLYGRLEVNESDSDAMNAWARVKRGDVDQASFGFEILSEECQ